MANLTRLLASVCLAGTIGIPGCHFFQYSEPEEPVQRLYSPEVNFYCTRKWIDFNNDHKFQKGELFEEINNFGPIDPVYLISFWKGCEGTVGYQLWKEGKILAEKGIITHLDESGVLGFILDPKNRKKGDYTHLWTFNDQIVKEVQFTIR